jgi:filamentous hemagglutinin
VIAGKDNRDAQRLERLFTPSGQAVPDTTLEEVLLGVRVPARGTGTAAVAKQDAQALATARLRNNIEAESSGLGSSAVRDFKPGTTHRAENINAGQVTDRDGLQRIDEPASENWQQIKDVIGRDPSWWKTQRPAWMEGTTVVDRVTTKPEVYRMVVDQKAYLDIRDSLKTGDQAAAAKNLGAWATRDPINTASDVRNNLAISSEWKGIDNKPMYVVEFTVKPGVGVREGTVGPMFDRNIARELPGGGHQVQFLQNTPRDSAPSFVINPGNMRLVK